MKNSFTILKHGMQRESVQNFLTLFTGNAVAQFITLVCMPLVTRLYSPEEFGVFALFGSMTAILSEMGMARFEKALVMAETEEDAEALGLLAMRILKALCLTIAFVFLSALPFLWERFVEQPSYGWFALVPLGGWWWGKRNIYACVLNRRKEYLPIARSRVWQASGNTTGSIMLGWIQTGVGGLTGSYLFSSWVQQQLLQSKVSLPQRSGISTRTLISRYRNFPLFALPMTLLNSFSTDILIYFLSFWFGVVPVGLYSNARKVLQFSLNIITTAFTPVFFQKMTETSWPLRLYLFSFLINLIGGSLLLLPIFLWGKPLFSFVLGNAWGEAGRYASILVPFAVVSFAVSNVSMVFDTLQKNQYELIWQVVYLVLTLLLLYLCHTNGLLLETLLFWFSVNGIVMYLVLFFVGYWLLWKHRGLRSD